MMNVHHLELFYYVARYGGISAAVRQIPYGIQQPAVSAQIGKLEDEIGAKLFERTPFQLTPAGELLFAHLQPFFENLATLKSELQREESLELRLGGSEFVLRDHIPEVMQRMKVYFPKLRFSLRTGYQSQLEELVRSGEIDLAATLVEERAPPRLRRLRIVKVPLVLLAHRRSALTSAADLWTRKVLAEPLVGLPPETLLTRNFQRGLNKMGVKWPQTAVVASIDLTTRYVANGDGFGFNIGIDSVVSHPDVLVLPLDGFEPVIMGVIWRSESSVLVNTAIEVVQQYSRETWPDWFVEDSPT